MWFKKTIILLLSILTPMLFIITCLYNPFLPIGDSNASSSTSSSNVLYQYDFSDASDTQPLGWDLINQANINNPIFACNNTAQGLVSVNLTSIYGIFQPCYNPGLTWTIPYTLTFDYIAPWRGYDLGGWITFSVCFKDDSNCGYRFRAPGWNGTLDTNTFEGGNGNWTVTTNTSLGVNWYLSNHTISVHVETGLLIVKLDNTIVYKATNNVSTLPGGTIMIGIRCPSSDGSTDAFKIDNIQVTTP